MLEAARYEHLSSPSPSSSSEVWAPAICSSPLHSGGLSMDNPFEMFDEVGRSLKWFSLSKNAPSEELHLHQQKQQDVASDRYDSDSSSTFEGWTRKDDDDVDDDDDEDFDHHPHQEILADDRLPKIEELVEESEHKLDEQKDMPHDNSSIFVENKDSYIQVPNVTIESSKDPVSDLVRSFFNTRQHVQKKAEVTKPALDKKVTDTLPLEKKIEMLESESSKTKRENQRLGKMLKEKEEEATRLAQEKKQSFSNMEAFLLEKDELLQELKREKRSLEQRLQYVLQLPNALPNKTERKEIADLKAKLMDVHEEHLKREARLRLTNIRLRKLVKELSGKLDERQEEIKRYEKLLMDLPFRSNPPLQEAGDKQHGCRMIKAVECSSSDKAAVGCRITGALFHQFPPKQKTECKETSAAKKSSSSGHRHSSNPALEESLSVEKVKSTEDVLDLHLADRERSSDDDDDEQTVLRVSQRRSMIFMDGTREEEYQDGLACVYFANGDIKNSLTDGTTEYYYSEIDTWHTTKPDGVEIFYFPHNQIEEHWPDGQKRVIFPDGSSSLIKN